MSVHGFRKHEKLDENILFPDANSRGDKVSMFAGTMNYTYEWIPQLFTEFGWAPNEEIRSDGEMIHVVGDCVVIIHSERISYPDREAVKTLARELVETKDIRQMLVFVNDDDYEYFGSFFGSVHDTGIECLPQLLSDLSFNILAATAIYLEFRDKITWKIVNYLY